MRLERNISFRIYFNEISYFELFHALEKENHFLYLTLRIPFVLTDMNYPILKRYLVL